MPRVSNTCNRFVGRLLEIRVDGGYRTPADVDAMIGMMGQIFNSLQGDDQVIIAADWRRCTILGQGTADRALAMLSTANPRTLRSTILLMPVSPTAVMQVMRLISEASFPGRRVFTAPNDQIRWLEEVTTAEETARLKVFLERAGDPHA